MINRRVAGCQAGPGIMDPEKYPVETCLLVMKARDGRPGTILRDQRFTYPFHSNKDGWWSGWRRASAVSGEMRSSQRARESIFRRLMSTMETTLTVTWVFSEGPAYPGLTRISAIRKFGLRTASGSIPASSKAPFPTGG